MKKKMIPAAILAVLSMMTVSCQKENAMEILSETSVLEVGTVYTVQYAVNGVLHSVTIHDVTEEQALMKYLMALAREGYEVNVSQDGTNSRPLVTKETLVYTTKSEEDAIAWSLERIHEGYKVTCGYDPKTEEYICIATR